MDMLRLANLQISLFIMIIIGMFLTKKGLIDNDGRSLLTDLCINLIIPCNILKSCLTPFRGNILLTFGHLFLAGAVLEIVFIGLNQILFNRYPEERKKVLQYGTLVCNSGFLGYPIAEGVYGTTGTLYASVFLIPLRLIMWSVGTSYFIKQKQNNKILIKKVLSHPCLIAVYMGILIIIFEIRLQEFLSMTVKYIGNCNAAVTMFIVGTILAEIPLHSIWNKDSVLYSILRLVILPTIALLVSRIFRLDSIGTGIAILMTGMPAGATTAIFAARYESDAKFATQLTILSTVLSLGTILMWCFILNREFPL